MNIIIQHCLLIIRASMPCLRMLQYVKGEKPFLCKVEGCLKRFSESTVRIKHMRTHLERTQFFECKQCDKKYGHLDALRKHIKNKHKAEAPGTSASGAILTDTSNIRQNPAPSYSQVDYSGFYKHRDQMYIYPQSNYEY
ncbi:hypothetical protein CAEBREN_19165 [Caenorhabditis brenneri]|uniref:C2H2-type domain-containing protein n=1 Tax=Caenorhabditis brenneri TaxID=135651 RepID=G0N2K5_CAEBE|nr:hypothetical protein CAEBREN_19165 [Caenorhabditis brenneri]